MDRKEVEEIIRSTAPPGEILNTSGKCFDDRELFIDTLSFAIALKDEGKLLLEELRTKWPYEVASSMTEAEKQAKELVVD